MNQTKTCTKCKVEKHFSEFSKLKTGKYGLHSWCKECVHNYQQDRSHNMSYIRISVKTCSTCKKEKLMKYFGKDKYSKDGHRHICKECVSVYGKIHSKHVMLTEKDIPLNKKCSRCKETKNSDEFSKDSYTKDGLNSRCRKCISEHNAANKRERTDLDRQKRRKRDKERLNSDPLFRFKDRIRRNIKGCIYKLGYTKKSYTHEILGCDWDFFKEYIESKFLNKMTFENYGEWHLDHIIPISTAQTEKDVIRLCHYTNYQPLWAKDNLKKSNKIPNVVQFKLL